ncbi:MAG: hypothetical protein DLM52_09230 [Chthoniobacterales bacterium]|nr:MAG: hypothetical protein DLM52_09230 [Chthoniobacterales bacterium]
MPFRAKPRLIAIPETEPVPVSSCHSERRAFLPFRAKRSVTPTEVLLPVMERSIPFSLRAKRFFLSFRAKRSEVEESLTIS